VRLALTYCAPERIDAAPPDAPEPRALDGLFEETIRW